MATTYDGRGSGVDRIVCGLIAAGLFKYPFFFFSFFFACAHTSASRCWVKIDDWSEPEPMAPLATEWPTFVSSFFFFSFIVRALFFCARGPGRFVDSVATLSVRFGRLQRKPRRFFCLNTGAKKTEKNKNKKENWLTLACTRPGSAVLKTPAMLVTTCGAFRIIFFTGFKWRLPRLFFVFFLPEPARLPRSERVYRVFDTRS